MNSDVYVTCEMLKVKVKVNCIVAYTIIHRTKYSEIYSLPLAHPSIRRSGQLLCRAQGPTPVLCQQLCQRSWLENWPSVHVLRWPRWMIIKWHELTIPWCLRRCWSLGVSGSWTDTAGGPHPCWSRTVPTAPEHTPSGRYIWRKTQTEIMFIVFREQIRLQHSDMDV